MKNVFAMLGILCALCSLFVSSVQLSMFLGVERTRMEHSFFCGYFLLLWASNALMALWLLRPHRFSFLVVGFAVGIISIGLGVCGNSASSVHHDPMLTMGKTTVPWPNADWTGVILPFFTAFLAFLSFRPLRD